MLLAPRNVQLRRTQMPLELAVAQTIHGGQGDTEAAIATCLDGEWKNHLWMREMLFTLLTRVGRLEDIYLVGYRYHIPLLTSFYHNNTQQCTHHSSNPTLHSSIHVIRREEVEGLLRRRTWWHPIADAWLDTAALRGAGKSMTEAIARLRALRDLSFYLDIPEGDLPMPMAASPVAYLIFSPTTGKQYIGSTWCLQRRLRQHRSRARVIAGAINTYHETDWQVAAYVIGFPESRAGRSLAYAFEKRWQTFPTAACRHVAGSTDIARCLIAAFHTAGTVLRLESTL